MGASVLGCGFLYLPYTLTNASIHVLPHVTVYKHTHTPRCVCTLGYVVFALAGMDSHKLRVLSSLTVTMGDSLSQKVKHL